MSSSEYDYNAPQFYSNLTDVISVSDEEDAFFDAKEGKDKDDNLKDPVDPVTENKENVILISDEEENSLNESFSKIKIRNKFEGIELALGDDRKSHPMLTRQDVSILSPKLSLELRSRPILKEVGAAPKPSLSRKRKADFSPIQGSIAKYRSLAESIYHFQKDTPPRFRGLPKNATSKHSLRYSTASTSVQTVTVPETPHFISGQRLRHCTDHCLSHEDQELLEIEKAKKDFKPQQLNKKIFEPLKEVDREKHFTIPKPFKLTEPSYKKVEKKNEVFVFKARPFPQKHHGHEYQRVSTNRLPVLMEESEEHEKVNGVYEIRSSSPTKVKPFSFDERDKLRAIRKKERIAKIIENQTKAAVFKAQPLPSYISDSHNNTLQSCSSTSSHRHEPEVHYEFKAKPAVVLHKKPFQVKKREKDATKTLDIKLNTETRAQQRQAYDEQRKAIQIEKDSIEAQCVKEEELKTQEEIAKLRKELVHKPLPVPKSLNRNKQTSSESLDEHSDS